MRTAQILALPITLAAWAIFSVEPAFAAGTSASNCSIAISNSNVAAPITVNCVSGNKAEAEKMAQALNKLAAQNQVTRKELQALTEQVNRLLALSDTVEDLQQRQEIQGKAIENILAIIRDGGSGSRVVSNVQGIVEETIAKLVQYVGPVKVTLKRVVYQTGHLTIYFQVLNEGITDQKISFSGHGGTGSSIIIAGQRIEATSVDIGGNSSKLWVRSTLIPKIALEGRLDFDGVHSSPESIAVVEILTTQAGNRNFPLRYTLQD